MNQTFESEAPLSTSVAVAKPWGIVPLCVLVLGLWGWSWLGPTWVAAMRTEQSLNSRPSVWQASAGPIYVMALRTEQGRMTDFYQEWGSARNYWCGLPIYTPHSTSVPRYLGLPSNPMPSIEYNIHPPTSVLLTLPLGRLDYPDAVLAWNVISLLAFLASLGIVARMVVVPRALFWPGVALLSFCHPLYASLHQGQLTLCLVLLITAMWALARSGRFGMAGALLGAAAAIKLFPVYLAIYYAAQGRVRLLLTALISFLTLTLITVFVLGLDAYHDYVGVVLPWNAGFRTLNGNISIAGLWYRLFYPVPGENIVPLCSSMALARWGTLISSLAMTAIVATAAYRAQTPAQRELAFAMTATAMLLVSPVTWDHGLPILLAPFILIACSPVIARSTSLSTALVLILVISSTPNLVLWGLFSPSRSLSGTTWIDTIGAPSFKFYALLGTFLLALTAFRCEAASSRLKAADPRPVL